MARKPQPPSVNQTAIGNDNIQVVGSNNVITRITNFFAGDTEQQRALRNRRAMLELVKNTWIKGVLEKSLYNEVLMDLGLEEHPGAVDRPWDMQVQMPDQENRTLPPGTSMLQVFDEMNGAILILGEPGSGKTTMLLELARECIDRASQDDNRPIPVVFNLSSWNGKQAIPDWLVSELNRKYHVPKKIARDWVNNGELQLLFDGLDEVKREDRDECVKVINDFRQIYGLTLPIAVCSRILDYEALTTKLSLEGAVLLQPLTSEQIDKYFEQAGCELAGAYQMWKNDKALQELVKQPLILSIMMLAYQGRLEDAIRNEYSETVETRRRLLFDTYIQQMFERAARTKSEFYAPEQTRHWLAWLAQKMIEHNAVPYVLENMQPDWLSYRQQGFYRLYIGMMDGLLIALTGLAFGLAGGLAWGLIITWIGWIVAVLWSAGRKGLRKIEMADTLTWDWKKTRRGMIFGLILGLIFGLIIADRYAKINGLFGLMYGLIVVLMMLLGGLSGGLTAKPISQTIFPGQRISLTLRNFLFTYSLLVLFFGFSALIDRSSFGLIMVIGLILALPLAAGRFGASALALHGVLRSIVSRNNYLPWKLIPFLDYCVDRIFLRRVGGAYIFVHRLLMEHFAAMYSDGEK